VIRLATTTIARCIVTGRYPSYRWEVAIEPHVLGNKEDRSNLLSGLKFLEERHPGEKWDAAEINGLMLHHCTGRRESVESFPMVEGAEIYEDADGTFVTFVGLIDGRPRPEEP
jgi:hypothetical protein